VILEGGSCHSRSAVTNSRCGWLPQCSTNTVKTLLLSLPTKLQHVPTIQAGSLRSEELKTLNHRPNPMMP
jgi:hypothetical protein